MKNLYKKGKIHPSPPPQPPPPATISHHLALLPATILTLITALSPQDKEVLAYLISSGNNSGNFSVHRKLTNKNSGGEHGPRFECDCFRCYMSYWARWDNSPNRQLIHEIIDAYEDGLYQEKNKKKTMKVKKGRKRSRVCHMSDDDKKDESLGEFESVGVSCGGGDGLDQVGGGGGGDGGEVVGLEKGSVRKLVSYIGEKFWGVWNM